MTQQPRNRDVNAAGHPTQFAAVQKTQADVALEKPRTRREGDLVSLEDVDGIARVNGTILDAYGDGTYRVETVDRDGEVIHVYPTTEDLGDPLQYSYGEHVVITDRDSGEWLAGTILRPGHTPEHWEVEFRDTEDGRTYTAEFDAAKISTPPFATLAIADPDEHYPGTHPDFPGTSWGIHFSSHWQVFDVNHGYYGGYSKGLGAGPRYFGKDADGNEVVQPKNIVAWTTGAGHTADDAELIWENRDAISAGLLEQGFGERQIRIRVNVLHDTIEVQPYDYPDDFTAFTLPRG